METIWIDYINLTGDYACIYEKGDDNEYPFVLCVISDDKSEAYIEKEGIVVAGSGKEACKLVRGYYDKIKGVI